MGFDPDIVDKEFLRAFWLVSDLDGVLLALTQIVDDRDVLSEALSDNKLPAGVEKQSASDLFANAFGETLGFGDEVYDDESTRDLAATIYASRAAVDILNDPERVLPRLRSVLERLLTL